MIWFWINYIILTLSKLFLFPIWSENFQQTTIILKINQPKIRYFL